MTDTEIIIAVAKLDGWSEHETSPNMFVYKGVNGEALLHSRPHEFKYLTSRDAIVPVIEKCINTDAIQTNFNYKLYELLPRKTADGNAFTYVMAVLAKPRELSIALLKATGNYSS